MITVKPGGDARDHLRLTDALHDVSGMRVCTPDEARQIQEIPRTVRVQLFVEYRGNLPGGRYYTSRVLDQAPDHSAFNRMMVDEGDAPWWIRLTGA